MKIKWHRGDHPRTAWSCLWTAEIDGVTVAEAVQTGRSGVDDYPWDWRLTEAGKALPHGRRASGVTDTLRSAKYEVAATLGVVR